MAAIATLIAGIGILALLLLNRDPRIRTSPALWLPVTWIAIATSRPVSIWFGMAPDNSADKYLEGSPLDRNVFAALLALGLIVLIRRRRRVMPLLRSNWPLLLFYSYCALSILWSDFPDITLKRWIKALGDVVMILVVLTESDPSAATKRVFAPIAFLFAPLSLLFMRYYGDLGRTYSRWEGTVSYTGIAVDKNMLGMACLILGLAAMWQLLQELTGESSAPTRRSPFFSQRRRSIIAHGLVLAMLVLLLIVSKSMTALGCFVLSSVLMIAVSSSTFGRRRGFIHVMVAAIVTLVFVTLFVDVGALLLERLGRDSTLTGRTALWSVVLAHSGNPLVGTGFESFWLGPRLERIWRLQWWHPNQAHNGYLEVYVTLGWIGLGLLAIVIVKGYRDILRMVRYDPTGANLRLAFFVVAIAYNLTEAAFKTSHPVWLAFLLAVIAVPRPAARMEEERQSAGVRRMRAVRSAEAFAGSYNSQRRFTHS